MIENQQVKNGNRFLTYSSEYHFEKYLDITDKVKTLRDLQNWCAEHDESVIVHRGRVYLELIRVRKK